MKSGHLKSKKYQRLNLIFSISSTLLSLMVLMAFVLLGFSEMLRDWVSTMASSPYVQFLFFVAVAGTCFVVLLFPITYLNGFWLEHRFNLSNQNFVQWLWEESKAMMVALVITLPLLEVFYFFLIEYPETWWLWFGSIMFVFSIVLGKLAPQLIFPLFYTFEKLDDPQLMVRMQRLADEGNFNIDGVYRFDMSKATKKANAAFTGFGKSKRIIIGDTLLENFSADEIETVFAHEVGHYVHKHILIGTLIGMVVTFGSLFLAASIYGKTIAYFNFDNVADLAAQPLLAIILLFISVFFAPINNVISRRHEYQADRYALEHSTKPWLFAAALKKLAQFNLSDPEPAGMVEFLFHSHPSIKKRVDFADGVLAQTAKNEQTSTLRVE